MLNIAYKKNLKTVDRSSKSPPPPPHAHLDQENKPPNGGENDISLWGMNS